jgi:hypothetical protein
MAIRAHDEKGPVKFHVDRQPPVALGITIGRRRSQTSGAMTVEGRLGHLSTVTDTDARRNVINTARRRLRRRETKRGLAFVVAGCQLRLNCEQPVPVEK